MAQHSTTKSMVNAEKLKKWLMRRSQQNHKSKNDFLNGNNNHQCNGRIENERNIIRTDIQL